MKKLFRKLFPGKNNKVMNKTFTSVNEKIKQTHNPEKKEHIPQKKIIPEWYSTNGKYGFRDQDGNIVIEAIYEYHGEFIEGLARVSINKKWGYINTLGKVVVPLKYDKAYDFRNSFAVVGNYDTSWAFGIINKSGKEIFKPNFDPTRTPEKISEATTFVEGLMAIRYNASGYDRDWGFLDTNGNLAISKLKGIAEVSSFSEGLCKVCSSPYGKSGFINKAGEIVIECAFDDASYFSEGLAAVKKGNKWGYIDSHGNEILPFIYDRAYIFENGKATVETDGERVIIDRNGHKIESPANSKKIDYDKIADDFIKELDKLKKLKNYDPSDDNDYSAQILTEELAKKLISLNLKENSVMLDKIKKEFQKDSWLFKYYFSYIGWDDMGCKFKTSTSIYKELFKLKPDYVEWLMNEILSDTFKNE
jgi:hypothetical protein